MFCSEVSNGTSILKNNTVYKLKPIQFSTTFKHEHYGKSNTSISLALTILQMNYKRSLNKGITKYLCKISLKNFENLGNIELYSFVCKFVYFLYVQELLDTITYKGTSVHACFQVRAVFFHSSSFIRGST